MYNTFFLFNEFQLLLVYLNKIKTCQQSYTSETVVCAGTYAVGWHLISQIHGHTCPGKFMQRTPSFTPL